MRKPQARKHSQRPFDGWHGRFARATGHLLGAAPEPHPNPDLADHLWIDIALPPTPLFRIALNTRSRRNALAGFDGRIRMGFFRSELSRLPSPGIREAAPCDYADIEARENVFYEFFEQAPLEERILMECEAAVMVAAWGDLYTRGHEHGLHQIHSRRASCAVDENLLGRDGGLVIYFDNPPRATTFLFKFCGQP